MANSESDSRKPFEIYRATDQLDYAEHNIQTLIDPPPAALEALGAFATEGGASGQHVTLAYARPGISLTRVWFKSGYPLPLHSHSGECCYFILAGGIRFGTEALGPGDGFFVGDSVPYTYEIGPDGVEVLEFRSTDDLDIRFQARNRQAWDKIATRLRERCADWVTELPPSQVKANG